MLGRFMRILMLSAAVLALSPPLSAFAKPIAPTTQKSAQRMTASDLLGRQAVAVKVIADAYTALPERDRGKSMPFLKGLLDLANAYRDVATAGKAHDGRKMGAALPKVATSLAKLNSAYQMSGIRDRKIKDSLKSLDGLWRNYLKVVEVGKPPQAAAKTKASARRIDQLRKSLMRQPAGRKFDARERARRAQLLALIREAEAASREADRLWYANMLMAEAYGYYAGLYEYYTAYSPDEAEYYRDGWDEFSSETRYFYSESVSYYEEYQWSSYEQTVEVSESYDFGMTAEEMSSAITKVESTDSIIDDEAVELYRDSGEREALDTIETRISDDEVVDPEEDAPDEQVAPDDGGSDDEDVSGDDSGSDDEGVSGDDDGSGDEDVSGDDGGSGDEDVSGDDGGSDDEGVSGDDDGSGDEDVSGDDGGSGDEDVSGDDGGSGDEDVSGDDDGSGDEDVSGDDGGSDDEDLSGDDGGSDDEDLSGDDGGSDDEDVSGDDGGSDDVCASDDPPAECASGDDSGSDEDYSGDDSGGGEDFSGDDEDYSGDDSGGGEDYSGDDSGGGEDYSGDDSGGGEDYSGEE